MGRREAGSSGEQGLFPIRASVGQLPQGGGGQREALDIQIAKSLSEYAVCRFQVMAVVV